MKPLLKNKHGVSRIFFKYFFLPRAASYKKVRSREHIGRALGLDAPPTEEETKLVEDTLGELKRIRDERIAPLEGPYRYSGLSNRHFGDPEIFARPLVVLMGPYSGGKSTMINYLLGTEFTKNAFRAGEIR